MKIDQKKFYVPEIGASFDIENIKKFKRCDFAKIYYMCGFL